MARRVLGVAIVALLFSEAAHAEAVSRFDEICLAREANFCAFGPHPLGYGTLQHQMRYYPNEQVRSETAANYASQRAKFVPQMGPPTQDGVIAYQVCVDYIRSLGDVCVNTIDIATAAEIRAAIRESNDAALKAWLGALDAKAFGPQP